MADALNVEVAVRVRPLSSNEIESNCETVTRYPSETQLKIACASTRREEEYGNALSPTASPLKRRRDLFTFDYVFDEQSAQDDIR